MYQTTSSRKIRVKVKRRGGWNENVGRDATQVPELLRDSWLTGNEKQKRDNGSRLKRYTETKCGEKKNEVAINMKIAVSADRRTRSLCIAQSLCRIPILFALPNFMTKSKYLNFLAYAHKTYWTRRGRESAEEGNSMRTIERSGRREREKKRTISIGSETGFYTERARKKKKRARVENRSVIST